MEYGCRERPPLENVSSHDTVESNVPSFHVRMCVTEMEKAVLKIMRFLLLKDALTGDTRGYACAAFASVYRPM